MDQETVCCRVLQTLLVLTLFYNCQCCIYELPECRESTFGLSVAEYGKYFFVLVNIDQIVVQVLFGEKRVC